jgi:hypothetical protein
MQSEEGTTMSRSLDQLDNMLPLTIDPYQCDLDRVSMRIVEGLAPIVLAGDDVKVFLAWVAGPPWQEKFEEDLQSLANDGEGRELLTTCVPLVTFRESFCAGGRHMQDIPTQVLMESLRAQTRSWRDAGVDTVVVSGCKLVVAGDTSSRRQAA